jgi:hypothetical protein
MRCWCPKVRSQSVKAVADALVVALVVAPAMLKAAGRAAVKVMIVRPGVKALAQGLQGLKSLSSSPRAMALWLPHAWCKSATAAMAKSPSWQAFLLEIAILSVVVSPLPPEPPCSPVCCQTRISPGRAGILPASPEALR